MTAPTAVLVDMSWLDRGNCTMLDNPDVMHPDPGDADGLAEARFVCRGCPVVRECLAWATATDTRDGVWAGLTTAERGRPKKRPQTVNPERACDDCGTEYRSTRHNQRRCTTCSRRANPPGGRSPAHLLARADDIAAWKRDGLSDVKIARMLGCSQSAVTLARRNLGIAVDGTVRQPQAAA